MQPLDYAPKAVPTSRVWLARTVAVVADLVQVGGFAVTAEGAFSPLDDGLDVITAILLTLLVGWHIAFIPSFLVKLLPVADLAPTWTVAVLLATAGRGTTEGSSPLAPVPVLPASDPGGRRGSQAARFRALSWFAVVFAIGFAVGQFYLMPHLPPISTGPHPGRVGPWRENWAGALVGGGLGLLAARTVLRRAGRA
jgi:hypothetical protein